MRHHLHLDFETYSDLDIRDVGAYRYAEHLSTSIMLTAYAIDDGPVYQWQPHLKSAPPSRLVNALEDDDVYIVAHNAEFERQIIIRCMGINPRRSRFRCTAVRAAAAGLPRGLDGALAGLGHPVRKDPRGKAALRRFCAKRKPSKKDLRTRILPVDDPERWQVLVEYNAQDVHAERALDKAIPDLAPREWRYYHYICRVNDRGLPLDTKTLAASAKVVAALELQSKQRVQTLTGGINPTQVEKLRVWMNENGADLPNLQLKTLNLALREKLPPAVREIIGLRIESSRASTKKIKAMLDVVCADGRAHGTLLPFGAHTGRLSGKLIQPHNFTRGLLDNSETKGAVQTQVLELFRDHDADVVNALLWHQPEDTISGAPPLQGPMSMLAQSMRGYIMAPEGYWFLIADYAAIEARILAWVANEVKLLIAYRNNVDTYKMMASVLYKVAVELVTKEQRRIGKNLRLGAGYQLGAEKLVEHCAAEEIIITLAFAKIAIKAFRDDNPNIVRMWYHMEEAAIRAVQGSGQIQGTKEDKGVYFEKWRDWLLMGLPSGRRMHYYAPAVEQVVKFGKAKLQVSYYGQRKHVWGRTSTYGGKLVENMVQAIARDIMLEGMLAGEEAGYPALASIHDEIVTLRRLGKGNVKELEQAICKMPRWAQGIPLGAEGFDAIRYRKG